MCCSDGEHCCPRGYRCNLVVQTCEKASGASLPWLQKVPVLQEEPSQALSVPARRAEVVCDNQTSCPRDTSCCFMQKMQKWGCCPVPNVGFTVFTPTAATGLSLGPLLFLRLFAVRTGTTAAPRGTTVTPAGTPAPRTPSLPPGSQN